MIPLAYEHGRLEKADRFARVELRHRARAPEPGHELHVERVSPPTWQGWPAAVAVGALLVAVTVLLIP